MLTAALFTLGKAWKLPNYPSIHDWMKKKWINVYNGILLRLRKNEILPVVITWMDLENIMISETIQTEKETLKNHMD